MFGKLVKGFVPTVIFTTMVLLGQTAWAENIEISGIRINSSDLNGYEILIDAPTMPEMEKKVVSDNTIVLSIKNAEIPKGAAVVYNNAKGIEHVILKRISKDDLEVNITGENIAHSSILLNSPKNETEEIVEDRVFVNRPLSDYEPIHQENYYETEESPIISLLIRIKNSQTLRDILNSSSTGWIACMALIFGFLYFSKNKNEKVETKTVQTNVPAKREEEEIERARGYIGEGLRSDRTGSRLPQRRPVERENIPSRTMNYGLRAYNNQAMGQRGLNNVPTPKKPEVPNVRAEQRAVSRNTVAHEVKEKRDEIQIDNVKFLESMAKIYQKSGRTDLANGLANNIKKAKSRS